MARNLGNILSTIAFAVLFLLCLAFAGIRVSGLSTFVVTGGSMEPSIHKGSLVLVQPVSPSVVKVGDVITFQQYEQMTTHRVTRISDTTVGLGFTTKGDANVIADPEDKTFPGQVGIVRAGLPVVGYAVASLSCTIGPFLAVTGAGVGGTSVLGRAWIYLAYAAGFALVVGALAVAVALAGSALVERMRRILPYVNRIGGAVLILVGLYVGYYGFYEIRLFTAGGNPADPVIAAAGRLQGTIAGWVHRHGAWPWVVLLAVLLLAALVWTWRAQPGATWRRRRSRADRATVGDEP